MIDKEFPTRESNIIAQRIGAKSPRSKSAPVSPAGLEKINDVRINWDNFDEDEGDVFREADEISMMIDNALGVVPTSSSKTANQDSDSSGRHVQVRDPSGAMAISRDKQAQSQGMPPTPVPYSPTTASQDMLCVKVLCAYGLPEMLGGTNPYIVFDWGHLGRASTQAIKNTTSPNYNATLRFKSPSEQGSSLSTSLMNSPPLSISVYSRNESLSDALIGGVQLDDKDMNSNSPLRVYLYNDEYEECGVLEFQVYII